MKKTNLAVLAFFGCAFTGSVNAQEGSFSPYVDDQGNISRPTDFKTNPDWVHLGAWGVVNEGGEGNGIHNVYTTRDVVAYYRSNGSFPDGATLVKEVRGADAAALTTGRAHWATDIAVWFVSVKDTQGRFTDNPLWGDGWGWALFEAAAPAKQVATDYKNDCLGCHVPVQDNDWIYTYAYSAVLGPQAALSAPKIEDAVADVMESASMAASGAAGTVSEVTNAATARASQAAAAVTDGASAATTAVADSPAAIAASVPAVAQNIDLVAAEKAFKSTCMACHSVEPGRNGLGPSLAGVIGRKAGSAEGFNYSTAMKESDVVWTAQTLDSHLKDIKTFIPGNRMATLFPSGVKDDEKRKLIIDYLASKSAE